MSGTRALFASIGASLSLVAAAALSLLALSAVFAFGGWSDPVAEPDRQQTLILADASPSSGQKPLVLAARERPRPARTAAPPSAPPQPTPQAVITQSASRPPRTTFPRPAVDPPEPQPPVVTDPVTPSAGEGLGGPLQSTGDLLAQISDPVLPPVSAATQQVFDAVDELLRRSAEGVGTTVDGVLAP